MVEITEDELANLHAAVQERDQLRMEVARLRDALDKAHQDLFDATKETVVPQKLAYQVLVADGSVDDKVRRAIEAMGGVMVAELTDEAGQVTAMEFRSANSQGDESLALARALLPTARLESRQIS
jgi:multidrug resistance efflux pump